MNSDNVKVLYIAGSGRSGSTILGNILGQIRGFFYVGEILNIWAHFLIGDRLCACGATASGCEVWGSVLDEAFGDISQAEVHQMNHLRKHSIRNRYIPSMLVPYQRARMRTPLEKYLNNLEKLYGTIQTTRANRVIVDGSKRPTYAYLLRMIPTIDLYLVHLVRDPRAVAYSWLRRKVQQDLDGHRLYMQQYSPLISVGRWNILNLATEWFWRDSSERYVLLRYEDFVNNPQASIENILDLVQEKPAQLPFVSEHAVCLDVNHSILGNPNRFKTGQTELRLDEEWKEKMRRVDVGIVNAITWPLLIKYGYLGRKQF